MTAAQLAALKWLANRGGTGVFNRHQVLLARGELAGVMRATWNALRDAAAVTIEARRITITETGQAALADYRGSEAETVDDEL